MLPKRVEDRGAFDSNGGLFVPRKMCNGRLVETGTCVDVHGVNNVVGRLCTVSGGGVRHLVLPCRGKQQASVGGKGQATEERCQRFVVVDVSILHAQAVRVDLW